MLGVILALPIALFGIAKTEFARKRAARLATELIHTELGMNATLGDVNLLAFPPTIVAQNISLDHPVHGHLVDARTLRIRPSIFALLQGAVDLEEIEIEKPNVRLVMRDGVLLNIPTLKKSSGGKTKLPFSDLAITDAAVDFDADSLVHATIADADIDVSVEDGDTLEVRTVIANGNVNYKGHDEPIHKLDARARIAPNLVQIHEFHLDTEVADLGLRRVRIPLPFDNRVEGHVDVRADLAKAALLPHGLELPKLLGEIEAHADVQFHDPHFSGRGHLSIRDGLVKKFGTGDGEFDVAFSDQQIEITKGHIAIIQGGGTIDVTGKLGLGEALPVDADVKIHGLEFAKLMDQLGVSKNAIENWNIDAEAKLTGTCNPMRLEGPITMDTRDFLVWQEAWHASDKHRVMGVTHADIEGTVAVRADGLRFSHMHAELPNSRFNADVLIGFSNELEIRAHSDYVDLADITPLGQFSIGGIGSFDGFAEGTMSDPRVHGHMNIRDFAFDGKKFGDVDSEWHLEKDGVAVRFPMIEARKNLSRYRVENFFMDLSNSRVDLSGTVHADDMWLSDFYSIVNLDGDERFEAFAARMNGPAPFHFTHGFPGDSGTGTLDVDLDFNVPQAVIDGFAFKDGYLNANWLWKNIDRGSDGGIFTVRQAELHKGGGTVTAQGIMRMGGLLDFNTVADGLPLHEFEGLGERMPLLGGEVSVMGHIGGTLPDPRMDLDVQMAGLSWNGANLGDGRAYVRHTDRNDPWVRSALSWNRINPPENEPCAHARAGFARGTWPEDAPLHTREGLVPALSQPMAFLICGEGIGGKVKVDLAVGRTSAAPLRGMIEMTNIDIAPFVPRESASTLHGSISARTDLVGGSMFEDNSLVGRVTIRDLRVGQSGLDIRSEGNLDIKLNRGRFDVEHGVLSGPGSSLRVSGGGTARELSTRLEGDVDLALLQGLMPGVTESHGRVALEMRITGAIDQPEVFGNAIIADAGLRLAGMTTSLDDIHGEFDFSQRRVDFHDLAASYSGGTIHAQGSAEVEGTSLQDYSIDIALADIALTPSEGIDIVVGGQTRLAWNQGERLPTLTGTLDLAHFSYTRPMELGQTLSISELSRRRRTSVQHYDPNADRVAIDLRVHSSAPFHVENNIAEAEISIRENERPFRLVGSDQRFSVLGSLGIDRGIVRFRSSNFDIQNGVIDFDDETEINPSFDVRATTLIRRSGDFAAPQWRITLQVRGTADSLQLQTSSEPELSQEDIALLLTMGMTRAEAQQLQVGQIGESAALEALATVTGVDREIRNAVPVIDDFHFASAYSVRTGRMEPQVSIGKRITDRIRLSGMTSVSESRDMRATVDWRLDDHTSLQGGYDNMNTMGTTNIGNIGVDLRWRLEFQ